MYTKAERVNDIIRGHIEKNGVEYKNATLRCIRTIDLIFKILHKTNSILVKIENADMFSGHVRFDRDNFEVDMDEDGSNYEFHLLNPSDYFFIDDISGDSFKLEDNLKMLSDNKLSVLTPNLPLLKAIEIGLNKRFDSLVKEY